MFGLAPHDASARRANERSRRPISAAPTCSLRANTMPARIDSTIAGVPASSQISGSGWYDCPVGVTKRIVPPPGTVGAGRRSSARLATRTPGVPGPPANLCGERNTASLPVMSIGRYGPAAA